MNATKLVATVEIKTADDRWTLIEPLGQENLNSTALHTSIGLHSELVLDREEPILDVLSLDDFGHAQVLGKDNVSLYERRAGRWSLEESSHLPIHEAGDRSFKGSLEPGVDVLTAHLAGNACSFSLLPLDRSKWSCQPDPESAKGPNAQSKGIWKGPPSLSAAVLQAGGQTIYVIAGVDGVSRFYEDGPESVASFSGWGGEITALKNPCGADSVLVASGPGDWAATDVVTGFEVKAGKPHQITNTLDLPGPVVLLRSSLNVPNPTIAVAVVHNLKTGRYELYALSTACAN